LKQGFVSINWMHYRLRHCTPAAIDCRYVNFSFGDNIGDPDAVTETDVEVEILEEVLNHPKFGKAFA
jgi:hypothetical protein